MQPVLIKIGNDPTVYLVTMGGGHLPLASENELKLQQKFMTDNGMNAQVWGWSEAMRPLMGPDLRWIGNIGALQAQVQANNAAEQARDAGTAAAIGALAQTIERLSTAGGGSVEAGALVEAVTDAVREAAASHTAAMTAIYNELVAARAEVGRLQQALRSGARQTADALEQQGSTA